jgi:hypothetical protein
MKMRTNAFTDRIEPADSGGEEQTTEFTQPDTTKSDSQSDNSTTAPSGSNSNMNNGISGSTNPSSGKIFNFTVTGVCTVFGSCVVLFAVLLLIKKKVKQ